MDPGNIVGYCLNQASVPGGDDRYTAGAGLKRGEPECFRVGGHENECA